MTTLPKDKLYKLLKSKDEGMLRLFLNYFDDKAQYMNFMIDYICEETPTRIYATEDRRFVTQAVGYRTEDLNDDRSFDMCEHLDDSYYAYSEVQIGGISFSIISIMVHEIHINLQAVFNLEGDDAIFTRLQRKPNHLMNILIKDVLSVIYDTHKAEESTDIE